METHVVLSGSERPPRRNAERLRDVDPASPVEVTVTLKGRELPGLEPGRSISRQQLDDLYAANPDDVQKVATELGKFGLKVEDASPSTRSLRVTGTAAQMEQAFHANLAIYNGAEGEFRGREGSLDIPIELEGLVTGVFGLDQRRVARRQPGIPFDGDPAVVAAGALSPADIEQRYNFPPGQGSGQMVGIAEFGGAYFPSDLATYCSNQRRPQPKVTQTGLGLRVLTEADVRAMPVHERNQVLDFSGEVNMDVQIVAGLCPEAEIAVYFTSFDQKGWVDLLNELIKKGAPLPVALSISWGIAEDDADLSPAARTAINERLQAAATIGITVCVSAGDDGSGDQVDDGKAHVNFPASSPNVLAVGGTMIDDGREVVWWQSPGERQDGGGSTGGGVSTVFDRPFWQNVQIASLNPHAIDGRVVPDIAALAGPPYYQLVFLGKSAPNGGTSASAPLLASLVARVAGARSTSAPPAFLAPLLYQGGTGGKPLGTTSCRDITHGNNATPQPGRGYDAGIGFDAVSGWGVPDGKAFLTST